MPRVIYCLIAVVALIVTASAARDVAADETVARAKPSSLAPRGQSGPRTYGAPIQRPIMKRRSRPRPHPHPPAPR